MGNSNNWYQFESINVPILTFSGSNETDNYLHLNLLKSKAIYCPNFDYKYIDNDNHFYLNKEEKIGNLVYDWIRRSFN